MKKVIVLISDSNYIEHTKSLFNSIKNVGNWKYDLCLIANNVDENILIDFYKLNVEVIKVKVENPYYAKFFLFEKYMKKWDFLYYMDCDFVVFDDINKITHIDKEKILVDEEPFYIHQSFCQNWSESQKKVEISKFENKFNFNELGINTGFMVVPTSIITSDTFNELMSLKDELQYINNHTRDGGTEQPIINLYFQNELEHIKNKEVCFWKNITNNTILGHFCRWEAPWKNLSYSNRLNMTYKNYYEKNLQEFNQNMKTLS
jgi:hypothetical protein